MTLEKLTVEEIRQENKDFNNEVHKIKGKKPWSARKLFISLLIFAVVFYSNLVGGHYYVNKKFKEYNTKAIQKADINGDGQVEIEEAINVYKEFGATNEEILSRIGDDAKKNYIKQVVFKSDAPSEIINSYLKNIAMNKDYLEVAFKETLKLADKNNNGFDSDEVFKVFGIAYGNKPVKKLEGLNYSSGFAQEFIGVFFYPYLLGKGSELERYVKEE